jgi:flavodoxin
MKTLVVYDSLYGNTEAIALAIGAAIGDAMSVANRGDVEVQRVGQVDPADCEKADLLVIGSPTHGALPTEAIQGLIATIGSPSRESARAATFDTRLTWPFLAKWGGFAAEKMADSLLAQGWVQVGKPGGFYVRGLKKGPLKAGELERAATWARGLLGS